MQASFGGSRPSGRGSSLTGAMSARGSFGAGPGRPSGSGRKMNTLCTSCKAPMSQDEVLMASATEGRCVACQQLAEAQSACRVCHLPWSHDQQNVVACDSCNFYMHENCVKKGALQTKSGGRLYTYCPHCPPTIPPPGGGGTGREREPGPSAAVKSERGGRGGQQRSDSLALALAAQQQQQQPQALLSSQPSGGGGGGRGRGGSGGADSNGLAAAAVAAAAAAALALPVQPQPALQQVAALLQGQLRMLQSQQQALLRQYELQLRAVTPGPPPSAYSLFQMDMFRVYNEEGFEIDPQELQPIISNAWNQLTPDERTGYDNRAQQELAGWSADAQLYVQLYYEYETLAGHLGVVPDGSMMPKPLQGMLATARQMAAAQAQVPVPAPTRPATGTGAGRGPGRPPGSGAGSRSAAAAAAAAAAAGGGGIPALLGSGSGGAGGGGGGRGVKRTAMDALAGASALIGMNRGSAGAVGGVGGGDDDDDDDEDYEEGTSKRARRAISPSVGALPAARPPPRNTRLPADKLPTGIADLPQQLTVSCNDVVGTFVMDGIKVICHCRECKDAPRAAREFHPTHWEQHCGAGTAKKWKASIKIEPGGAPEVPAGGNPMQIGKWFDMLGVEFRPAKTTGGPPVLEFTGATIRRLEAEGAATAGGSTPGSGGAGGGASTSAGAAPPPQASAGALPHPASSLPAQDTQRPAGHFQPQQAPPAPASTAALPTSRPPRSLQPTPPPAGGRGSVPPPATATNSVGTGGGSGAVGAGRRTDDGPTAPATANTNSAAAATAVPSKPAPRPVSDECDAEGDGDGDGEAAGYCPTGPASHGSGPGPGQGMACNSSGGGAGVVGYDGDSSSRGSASDTLGPNTAPA